MRSSHWRSRPEARLRNGARHAGLVVLLALIATACGRTYYTPEVAGVVTSLGPGPGGTTTYELANGQEVTIDASDGRRMDYGGLPSIGDLLLSGTGPDGPWIARLLPTLRSDAPPGCYELRSYGTDRGEWIETDAGLRLHKAFANFNPGSDRAVREGDRYEGPGRPFCVNENGEVTAFL